MKNWKRIIVSLLTVTLLGGMIAGCAKGEENKDKTSDSGEKKEVYVFIRDRGDLSYWDSMAEGGDRSAKEYKDRANVHVVETTADFQANLQAMYEAADAGADLIITASDFKDNLVQRIINNCYIKPMPLPLH